MHEKDDDNDTRPDEKLIRDNVKKQKTPLSKRIQLPPFDQIRKLLKPPIALLIGLIMTLSDRCREAIGQGSLLVCIVLVFYFPSRTFGAVLEDVICGTSGALVAAAYSLLAMYTADLARDPDNPIPVQPKSSGVLVVYMFIGMFIITYFRTKVARANFACINAGILLCFGLTDPSIIRGFQPIVIWSFLKPIALGGGIAVAVSGLIWPADSIGNYMAVLLKTLQGYNTFFKTHSNDFLSRSQGESIKSTLPILHQSLDNSTLVLIDCKRAVHRDILFSHLSGKDVSILTRMVKGMRPALHGIGLAQILRKELENGNGMALENDSEEQKQLEKDTLKDAIRELQALFQEISDTCYDAMNECIGRLSALQGPPNRTALNSILWPFPRFFIFSKRPPYEGKRTEPEELEDMIGKLDMKAGKSVENLLDLHHHAGVPRHYGGLHLISTYRYNLKDYARKMAELLRFVKELELKRQKRRIWLPSNKAFKKWFRPGEVDPNMGGDSGDYAQQGTELTLVRTNTRTDMGALDPENGGSSGSAFVKTPTGKLYCRDPDVDPPATAAQRFWYAVYSVRRWFVKVDTFFAFKTASGVVLLALPIYLPQSATWYYEWRGQWALIALSLWMFPMTGMFLYTILMRVFGTVLGGVFGIVVWEMTQGNPYGIAVVMFVVFVILYYLLVAQPAFRVLSIMTAITILLVVIYEFNYTVGAAAGNDPVWTLAGKRMLLVVIGVSACAILSLIPYPVTGRVELRKRLSQTIRDISKLYGILTVHMVQPALTYGSSTPQQTKGFRKLAINIRRQIADERTFHKLAVFEPPLRGRFPKESYQVILEKVDNMADLVFDMGHVLQDISGPWRQQIAMTLTSERRDYLASIMTTLKLLSTTLSAKMALPPYLIAPAEARERFGRALERSIQLRREDINNPSFLPYTTYVVLSATFVTELQALLEAVEDLVGIEDPEEWLRQHY